MSATLELVLDASGMQRGAQQATAALDSVGQKSTQVSASVQNVGRSMSAAFQSAGGSIQVAGGIAQTAKAFGDLNLAAGAFSASRTLLEIGKTVQDFREMRGAVGATGGAFSVLGGILRAHPLMVIATVVGGIATVMSLLEGNTKRSASAFDELAKSMQKADAANATTRALGGGGVDARLGALRSAYERTLDPDAPYLTATQFGASGIGSQMTALRYLAQNGPSSDPSKPFGGNQAAEYLRTGYYTAFGNPYDDSVPKTADPNRPGMFRYRGFPDLRLSPADQRGLITGRFRDLEGASALAGVESAGLYQFGANRTQAGLPASLGGSGVGVTYPNYVEQSADARARLMEENNRRQEESAARIASIFEGIGQDIGGVAADLAMGSVSMRQAITGLLQSLMRQGLQSGLGSIASSFGATLAQSGNPPMNKVGGP